MNKSTIQIIRYLIGIPNPVTYMDIHEATSKLIDISEDAELYIPDRSVPCYAESSVKNCWFVKVISKFKWVADILDCDDFAAILFGFFLGLLWTTKDGKFCHAMNWFFNENREFVYFEPQKAESRLTLQDWQGNGIKFFLGR